MNGPVVTFRDNNQRITEGFGKIHNKSMNSKNVSYVKGLVHNIIPIIQLCDAGYRVHFNEEKGNIIESNNSILPIAIRKNDIFVLDMFFV